MAILRIPVKTEIASYQFTIELERVIYTMRFRFNYRMNRWIMDLATRDDVDIVTGVPLVTGTDLFGRFKIDGLPPGQFMVHDTTGKMQSPGFSDFGNSVQLLYAESGTI